MRRRYAAANENRTPKNFSVLFIWHNYRLTAKYETNTEVSSKLHQYLAALPHKSNALTAPLTSYNESNFLTFAIAEAMAA